VKNWFSQRAQRKAQRAQRIFTFNLNKSLRSLREILCGLCVKKSSRNERNGRRNGRNDSLYFATKTLRHQELVLPRRMYLNFYTLCLRAFCGNQRNPPIKSIAAANPHPKAGSIKISPVDPVILSVFF
jgi:hypothetical protein